MRTLIVLTAATSIASASPHTKNICKHGENVCLSHVIVDDQGNLAPLAGAGLTPKDIQSAYQLDPNIATTPTIAIVDAYGYANLEQDLAMYRGTFGLPACTRANG